MKSLQEAASTVSSYGGFAGPDEVVGAKVGLVRLRMDDVRPSSLNGSVYLPRTDVDIRALASSIEENGLLEPIVVTRDGVILSGHSRYRACKLLRIKEIPCRVVDVWAGQPEFLRLLVEFNRQRSKTVDEILLECLATRTDIDDDQAYEELMAHREVRAHAAVSEQANVIEVRGSQVRKRITAAKRPMLEAVLRIIEANREFWPMSDRSIHYELQNAPPLRHASKPDSVYRNDLKSYKDLTDLLTRARIEGLIPFQAIEDPTRTSEAWDLHRSVAPFVERELDWFLMGYSRDLQQGQPNHIEIVGEKNTVAGSIRPVARKYGIPYTIARGYSSLEPRHKIRERFLKSGKANLVVLVMSDLDPEGEDIPNSIGKSLRDDLGVDSIDVVKVCLTREQASRRDLPPTMQAKATSSRLRGFEERHGEDAAVYELEALPSSERSRLLEEAVLSVMDVEAFDREVERFKADAARLAALRKTIAPILMEAFRGEKSD